MNVDRILSELRQERERLDEAIQALERVSGGSAAGPGRRGRRRRRHMSAETKRLLSERMKARWAERKKAKAKKSAA